MKKTKRQKKRIVAMTLIFGIIMFYFVHTFITDWPQIMANKSEVKELTEQYNKLLANEEKLVSDVTKLKDDEYIARYAKEKYMYTSPGETIIRMDDSN